jgi:glycosyltransferase involved in cell wall biosynthesis
MASLRIAQLMASGPVVGGLEKHFVDLCGGLSADHQVLALADPMHAAALPSAVEFCPFDFSGSRRNPFTLLRIHRLLKSFRPDVIHAQANKAAGIVRAIRYFSNSKRVATVHNIKRNNRVFNSFDAVICVSSAVREQSGLQNAQVILNGIAPPAKLAVDPSYFQQQFGLTGRRKVCLAVGRLAKAKGFAGLIRAWRGIDAELVIAGEGAERAELESIIKQYNLHDTVHLAGFRSDVPRLMTNADLLVMSSEREGFPYVMVEALHFEKIIVSTRFPGASDLLPEQFLVPYGDEQQLRQRVQQTLAAPDHARSEYRATWKRAHSQLTIEQMVCRTMQVYSQVLRRAA